MYGWVPDYLLRVEKLPLSPEMVVSTFGGFFSNAVANLNAVDKR